MKKRKANKPNAIPIWAIMITGIGAVVAPAASIFIAFPHLNASNENNRQENKPVKINSQTVSYDCSVSIGTSGIPVIGNERFTYMKKGNLVTIDAPREENGSYSHKEVAVIANEANGFLTFQTISDNQPTIYRLNLNTLALEMKVAISNYTDGTKVLPGQGNCKVVS